MWLFLFSPYQQAQHIRPLKAPITSKPHEKASNDRTVSYRAVPAAGTTVWCDRGAIFRSTCGTTTVLARVYATGGGVSPPILIGGGNIPQ